MSCSMAESFAEDTISMPRSFFSGLLKPASSSPFQAASRESPSVKAISPLPCCSNCRFSTEALVA